jgi:hypothetical protein
MPGLDPGIFFLGQQQRIPGQIECWTGHLRP